MRRMLEDRGSTGRRQGEALDPVRGLGDGESKGARELLTRTRAPLVVKVVEGNTM